MRSLSNGTHLVYLGVFPNVKAVLVPSLNFSYLAPELTKLHKEVLHTMIETFKIAKVHRAKILVLLHMNKFSNFQERKTIVFSHQIEKMKSKTHIEDKALPINLRN